MKAIVQVVFEIEVDPDNWGDYEGIDSADDPIRVVEEMVKFDVENFPEALESEVPTEITFKEWVK